jgi:hypothetical protein
MSILFNTVRDEIAKCLQVAYKKVSIVSAMEKLNFNDINEMKEFAIKVKLFNIIQFIFSINK